MTTKQISQRTGIPWSTLVTWAKSDPTEWRYQLVVAMSTATPDFFSKFNPSVKPQLDNLQSNIIGGLK